MTTPPGSDPNADRPYDWRDPAPAADPEHTQFLDPAEETADSSDTRYDSAQDESSRDHLDPEASEEPARDSTDAEAAADSVADPAADRPGWRTRAAAVAGKRTFQVVAALLVGVLLGAGATALIGGGRDGDRDRPGIVANDNGRSGPGEGRSGRGPGAGDDRRGPGAGDPQNAPVVPAPAPDDAPAPTETPAPAPTSTEAAEPQRTTSAPSRSTTSRSTTTTSATPTS